MSNPENTADFSKDGTVQSFMQDVIEMSKTTPVLVDFWATWCEPCKNLMPLLEKAVSDAAGAVRMVKLDIDQSQQIASQMQIRSVPTVVMFKNGQPVDAFTGVKNLDEINEFIAKHADGLPPTETEIQLEQAQNLVATGALEEAGRLYSEILQASPASLPAAQGLIGCLLQTENYDVAEKVIAGLDPKMASKPEILALKAELDTAQQLGGLGEKQEFETRIAADPDDFQARLDLSLILWTEERRDEAAEELLYIIGKDRSFGDDAGRVQLLKFFEMAGPMDAFTVKARKRLSILLFS